MFDRIRTTDKAKPPEPFAASGARMRLRSIAVVALAGMLAFLTLASAASAHSRVCLQADGKVLDRGGHGKPGPTGASGDCPDADLVEFVLGWRTEPPFTNLKNGADIVLRTPDKETPIANVTTLQAEYAYGNRTMKVPFEPQFGRVGAYTGDITPTRAGEYTLRIWGNLTVNGTAYPIDFRMHPAEVTAMGDVEFPEKNPDPASLERRVAALEAGGKGTPGFEPLAVLAGLGVALVAARRRDQA